MLPNFVSDSRTPYAIMVYLFLFVVFLLLIFLLSQSLLYVYAWPLSEAHVKVGRPLCGSAWVLTEAHVLTQLGGWSQGY